ncbi:hypothetical protein J4Q44_G00066310 [Coregonus suidteri]|uniref:Uncharacterized protein n=1 Tax=Coregonus suidteri TaxID=861788 RepID=A0AAN8REC1_9TELE
MSKLELFNAYLTERLTAAAMEITSAVERTITDYQEEISRSKEENERLRLLLDFKPHLQLLTKDPHQLTLPVSAEEVPPEQQHCEQEEDPEPTQIKEEQEEFCRTSQEEEQLQGQESDTKDFITVCVSIMRMDMRTRRGPAALQDVSRMGGQQRSTGGNPCAGRSTPRTSSKRVLFPSNTKDYTIHNQRLF